ncbi:DUF6415 family natural product biosynthesis protein [Streptomyces sp. OfavH-34-F]|uniref:DUF6415 family natural product biosynthesis protein n=1 Tax=Streptomyces sp. OfavH-34-F TaxID=2917760 RepID=UPI001EF1D539|nr:DUF6415 family natural product biosynthesis protein [Streptomyces sp. OfavH-34-F]MCG7522979.1 DUF6415 family natural product biosynthesis protein [Streptomyces sp. OfavH-34-F]
MHSLLATRQASSNSRYRTRGRCLGPGRDQRVAAAETVLLVLGEDSPVPESAADVEDLVLRLRGHVQHLGPLASPREPALRQAQQLCSEGLPDGYVPSRVHLVKLARATQQLLAVAGNDRALTVKSPGRWRWWRPSLNVWRGSVFALALAVLVLAASVPRR